MKFWWALIVCKLQIASCHSCQICHRCRRPLHAIARGRLVGPGRIGIFQMLLKECHERVSTAVGVGENRNLRLEIFHIRRAADFFINCFAFPPVWGFHHPPSESLAWNPNIRPHKRFFKLRNRFRSRTYKLLARSDFYLL